MYDAKIEEKDESMRFKTIQDRGYFDKVPNERLFKTKSCYVTTEHLFNSEE